MAKPYEELEDGPLKDKIKSTINGLVWPDPFVKFGATKCFLPPSFADYLDIIDEFEVRDDDIWVVTYPKTGTTWTQEMTWLIANDLDYNGAKSNLLQRAVFLEFTALLSSMRSAQSGEPFLNALHNDDGSLVTETSMELARYLKPPRSIKSHLPLNMLPKQIRTGEKKPKIIYVAREPKDVCVSWYHFRVTWESYLGTLEDCVEEFIGGVCPYGPYLPHVKEFWEIRDQPNILFLTYEEMKKDLSSVLDVVSTFLGKKLSENDKSKLADHLSFENMKNNPAANHDELTRMHCSQHGQERKTEFLRKGKVGSWKEEISPKQVELLNSWILQNKIDGLYPMSATN